MFLTGDIGSGSAQAIADTVSSNSFIFDGVDLTEGLRKFSAYWDQFYDTLPGYVKVGRVLNNVFEAFPPKFWFAMIIVVICMTLERMLRRF